MSRKSTTSSATNSADRWRFLFEAALMENDRTILPGRLRAAKDAVMDRIEDSFDTASFPERRLLLAALHTINELQRLSESGDRSQGVPTAQNVGHAA